MSKAKEILKYSVPSIVFKKAREHGIDPKHIELSSRKTHKYVYRPPNTAPVHFGAMFYEDYTKHKDRARLEAFHKRNHRWMDAPKGSAAWLSWYLLWT
jgi:hypothetical protein